MSQQSTNVPSWVTHPDLPVPGLGVGVLYQAYWNGTGWAPLQAGQPTNASYKGVTEIFLPNVPEENTTASNGGLPVGTYPNPTDLNNALSFFSSVMDLELSHYSAELGLSLPWPSSAFNISSNDQNAKTEHFILRPTNAVNLTDGMIDIDLLINNGKILILDQSKLSVETPFFLHPIGSSQGAISAFLDRYAAYSGDPTISNLSNLVNEYGVAPSPQEAFGNATMQVMDENGPYISFTNAPEGINNTYDSILLWYQNGVITHFGNLWNRIPIGSFNVNLSQDQAERIAENAATNYSFHSTVRKFQASPCHPPTTA